MLRQCAVGGVPDGLDECVDVGVVAGLVRSVFGCRFAWRHENREGGAGPLPRCHVESALLWAAAEESWAESGRWARCLHFSSCDGLARDSLRVHTVLLTYHR